MFILRECRISLLTSCLVANKKQLEQKKLFIESSVSDKALLGYCTFHHMLLHLMQSRPWLLRLIDLHVDKFLNSDNEMVRMFGSRIVHGERAAATATG